VFDHGQQNIAVFDVSQSTWQDIACCVCAISHMTIL
jgi:hypothetical protein